MHQIVFFHGLVDGANQVDSWSIVDQDVNSSKFLYNFFYAFFNAVLASDIALKGKGFSSFIFDLFGSGVDGSWKGGLGLNCFGENGNIGSVLGASKTDGQSDSPGGSGDDDGFSLEGFIGDVLGQDGQPIHILWRNRYDLLLINKSIKEEIVILTINTMNIIFSVGLLLLLSWILGEIWGTWECRVLLACLNRIWMRVVLLLIFSCFIYFTVEFE